MCCPVLPDSLSCGIFLLSSVCVSVCVPSLLGCCLLPLQKNPEQTHLRELRGELNAARAELSEAQQQLVTARGEQAKLRQLSEQPVKDKTLGGPSSVPVTLLYYECTCMSCEASASCLLLRLNLSACVPGQTAMK